MKKMLIIVCGTVIGFLFFIWLGLKIQPQPFEPFVQANLPGAAVDTVPLPAGLPAPVERFYRLKYGEQVPVIHSVVWSGRGTIKPFGVALPIRFRFYHEAGQGFRSEIDATFFGLRLFRATETLIDGRGWASTPGGIEAGEKIDQANCMRMWAEYIFWSPAVLLTDPRVRWEPVDHATAVLVVPYGAGEEHFIIRFDPSSGDLQYFEAMRYPSSKAEKALWINGMWVEDGKPWANFVIEETLFNVDVQAAIRGDGPETTSQK